MISNNVLLQFLSQLAWFIQETWSYPHQNGTPHRRMLSRPPLGCHFHRTLRRGEQLHDQNTTRQWKRCFRWTYHHHQPQINTGLCVPHERTFKASFTYSSGPSTASSDNLRPSLAKILNPAPGNHSGTYLTLEVDRYQSVREIEDWTNVLGTCQQGTRQGP